MSWGSRNFPLSGQNWKDPRGTFQSDWTLAWVLGSIGMVAFFIALGFYFGLL